MYLLLVAICHQTSPRDKPPLEGRIGNVTLRGWDYLSAKLEAAGRANAGMLTPAFWVDVTPARVQELFRDETLGDRLSDPYGRALLIRDLGQKMMSHSWNWAGAVNKTNIKMLMKLFGDDETKLVGKKVKLEVIKVRNPQTGELVLSLAVADKQ